jgi:hypothetical protein
MISNGTPKAMSGRWAAQYVFPYPYALSERFAAST